MKLGIIGSGIIVTEFLPKLVKMENMEVLGIMGVPSSKEQLEALCKENNIQHALYDFDELCALGIDTVYIAVPNFLHYDYCRKALLAGKHVIVEKPMVSNLSQAQELQKLAKEKDLFVFEAVTTLYFDTYATIKEWLDKIGTIKMVNCNYSQYSRRYDAFAKGEVLPAFDYRKAGGAMMDLNLYNLHFVTGLFGRPDDYRYYANIERNIDTSGTLLMKYPGFIALCSAAKDCSAPYYFVIEGTKGYIQMKFPPNFIAGISLCLNDGTKIDVEEKMASNRLLPEFRYFIDAINAHDVEAYFKAMNQSLLVSEICTNARLQEGIIFPEDDVAREDL